MPNSTHHHTAPRAVGHIATEAVEEITEQVGEQISGKIDAVTSTAKKYVTQKPVASLAIAAGVGLLLGFVFGRR